MRKMKLSTNSKLLLRAKDDIYTVLYIQRAFHDVRMSLAVHIIVGCESVVGTLYNR